MDISNSYVDRTAQMITEYKEKTGKTQETIAKEIGVSPAQISKIMSGNSKDARVSTFVPIAKYFNVSTDYLLGLEPIQTSNIDKKEICRRLHIPDEMYDVLKELFLLFSPSAFIEQSADDPSPSDGFFYGIMGILDKFGVKVNSSDKKSTMSLKYITLKMLFSEYSLLLLISDVVYLREKVKQQKQILHQKNNLITNAVDNSDPMSLLVSTIARFTSDNPEIAELREDIIEFEELKDQADAKEWQLQKQLSEFIDKISEELTKSYYFSDGKMYDKRTNEIVDEYPI